MFPRDFVLQGHHDFGPEKERTLSWFEHLRQPYESWWSTLPGTFRWLACRFFFRAGSIRVDFDDGAVYRHRFDLDTDDLLFLENREYAIQHSCLGPSIHPSIDRMPISKAIGQSPPFTAILCHIQDRIQHLEVGDTHVAPLTRKATFNSTVLGFGDFHSPNIPIRQ